MSTYNSNQNGDEIGNCNRSKYVALVCMVILISFGIKLNSWTGQNDIYHNFYLVILSFLGLSWLLTIWIDSHLIKKELEHSLDNQSNLTNSKWTYYTYLKAPHSYCFYLKVGLTIFCFMHLILTTTLIIQEVDYYINRTNCFDGLRLLSSMVDLISSLLQLIFIQNHSNIVINRYKHFSCAGCMILITLALLKWFTTIATEVDLLPPGSDSTFILLKSSWLFKLTHLVDHTQQICPTGTVYNIDISNFLPYIDPFTIEFNFLLAIQWLIIWQHIGHYKSSKASDYWPITEAHAPNDGIESPQSFLLHKSGRGLFAGIFCFIGSLISLIYYFTAFDRPNQSRSVLFLAECEDLIYFTASMFSLLIASLQLSRLGKSTESCIGSTDLMLLFFPLIAFFVRGYIRIIDIYSMELGLIDLTVKILGIAQPVLQAIFIYFASSKICDTEYLSQHKPGRQIVTLLIALNLVLWVSGAFRAKAKLLNHGRNQMAYAIFLDVCQPFILFYRYHSSVCLANIWKIIYS